MFERAQGVLDSIHGIEEEVAELRRCGAAACASGCRRWSGSPSSRRSSPSSTRPTPACSLELREEGARRIEALVLERELDVGAAVLPTDETAFETMPFVEDVLQRRAPPDHPLARRRRSRCASSRGIPFVLYRPEFSLHGHILDACRRSGLQPDRW